MNDSIGFKCLHYSVAESGRSVKLTVLRKVENEEFKFGIRTVDGTAKANADYKPIDLEYTFKKREREAEKVFEVDIIDDNEWSPDLDFFAELYDPEEKGEKARYPGDDTRTKVTILDDDSPG